MTRRRNELALRKVELEPKARALIQDGTKASCHGVGVTAQNPIVDVEKGKSTGVSVRPLA